MRGLINDCVFVSSFDILWCSGSVSPHKEMLGEYSIYKVFSIYI